MHAVAKDLQAIDFHVAQVGRVVVQVQWLIKKRLVDGGIVCDYATAQVNVHRFEEGLPLAAKSEGPVIALERGIQFSSFPVWEVLLVDGYKPALRVAAPEGVDIDSRHGFQRAVLGGTDLESDPHQHVDEVGLVLVALEGEQHALSPCRVKPAAQTHIVADVDGVDLHATVEPLEEVTHFYVWHVKVKVDIVVQRVGNVGATESHMEDAAWEACATAGDVVWGAERAEGPLTHLTWHVALADSVLLSGADAALHFLRESAVYTMLAAVQQRLGFAEPKTQSPARKKVIIIDKISS